MKSERTEISPTPLLVFDSLILHPPTGKRTKFTPRIPPPPSFYSLTTNTVYPKTELIGLHVMWPKRWRHICHRQSSILPLKQWFLLVFIFYFFIFYQILLSFFCFYKKRECSTTTKEIRMRDRKINSFLKNFTT